jgi:hypothetical protein
LMIVHQCTGCGDLSINRIAADDVADIILEIFERSLVLEAELRIAAAKQGIEILAENERWIVRKRIIGQN